MSFKDYQETVDQWAKQFDPAYWPVHEQFARLAEEVGELAKEINHSYGNKKKKDGEKESDISEELGDIGFTIICIANNLGLNLDDAFTKTMDKYKIRDKERWRKKE